MVKITGVVFFPRFVNAEIVFIGRGGCCADVTKVGIGSYSGVVLRISAKAIAA